MIPSGSGYQQPMNENEKFPYDNSDPSAPQDSMASTSQLVPNELPLTNNLNQQIFQNRVVFNFNIGSILPSLGNVINRSSNDNALVNFHSRKCNNLLQSKNVSVIIDANGKGGFDGRNGVNGRHGYRGSGGFSGSYGGNGGHGGMGTSGSSGGNGQNLIFMVKGDVSKAMLEGYHIQTANPYGKWNLNFSNDTKKIVIKSKGGNGGNGGRGGNGGSGGRGGDGGRGRSASYENESGGPGGNGGRGGNGGSGGPGGNAGPGGNGGVIVLDTLNPSLLMFFESDVGRGYAGSPGSGGFGGSGGSGGSGGWGGSGRGNGSSGRSGWSGSSGSRGYKGANGASSYNGQNGRVIFVVRDPLTGKIIESGQKKYHISIVKYKIKAVVDDLVYEPGEQLEIFDVLVQNTGHLSSPEGVIIEFQSTQTYTCNPNYCTYVLPLIKPGSQYVLQYTFKGKIIDDPGRKKVGKYTGVSKVLCKSTLYKRLFEDKEHSLSVQYPVSVTDIINPSQLSKGENAILKFNITNISMFDYGCNTNNGDLSFKLIVRDGLKLVGKKEQVHEVSIGMLGKKKSQLFQVEIEVGLENTIEFYSRLRWNIELYYKGKLVEVTENVVRVTPNYIAMSKETMGMFDVLFVTDKHLSKHEFDLYFYMFRLLGLRVNCWDVERYSGFSFDIHTKQRHFVSWVDCWKEKLICVPLSTKGTFFFGGVLPQDIISHLSGKDSGFVVINAPKTEQKFLDAFSNGMFFGLPKIAIEGKHLVDTYLISNPKAKDLVNRCNKHVKNLTKSNPERIYKAVDMVFQSKKVKWLKYALGKANLQTFPLNRGVKLFFTRQKTVSDAPLCSESVAFSSKKIPVDSNFFMIFKSIIVGLPLRYKFGIIMNGQLQPKSEKWEFTFILTKKKTKSVQSITFDDLLYDSIYEDLVYEVYYGVYNRFRIFIELIKANKEFFTQEFHRMQILIVVYKIQKYLKKNLGLFNKKKAEFAKKVKMVESLVGMKNVLKESWKDIKFYSKIIDMFCPAERPLAKM